MVDALRQKALSPGFDSRWSPWKFSNDSGQLHGQAAPTGNRTLIPQCPSCQPVKTPATLSGPWTDSQYLIKNNITLSLRVQKNAFTFYRNSVELFVTNTAICQLLFVVAYARCSVERMGVNRLVDTGDNVVTG